MRSLLKLVQDSDLNVLHCYHFNFLLFLPIWLARRLMKVLQIRVASEADVNNSFLNSILGWIFGLDLRMAPYLRPAFGVSILCLAERSDAGGREPE